MHNKNELLQQLTGQLYEGVLTDEGWSEALRTLSLVTGSPQASVVVFDTRSQSLAINESVGTFQEAVTAYNAHYHRLDDALAWASRAPLVGGWYLDRRDLGEAAMRRSEYYQDFMLRYGMASALCNRVAGDGDMDAYLSLQRRPGQPHYTDAELAAFGQFIPHVQRAVRMRMYMQRLAERAGLASVVLDHLHVPLLVLDAQGRVQLANAPAEALLRRQPLLAVVQGCLHPQGLRAGQFAQLLQSACGTRGPAIAGGATLANAQGRPVLQLLALPLPARLQAFNPWARPLALLVLHEPQQLPSLQQHLLEQLYGLTPAEARLALVLCQGQAPAQAAERLGISIGTVRSQLKAIFAKTGTGRQADLVRLLSALRVAG